MVLQYLQGVLVLYDTFINSKTRSIGANGIPEWSAPVTPVTHEPEKTSGKR